MMQIVIIEDEPLAADHLALLIRQLRPEAEVAAKLPTVKAAVAWFSSQQACDLVFMDIQLADGISFEIFQSVDIAAPIIFTTAYDQYALRAFKVNSIDYLLKPIDKQALVTAFSKLEVLRGGGGTAPALNTVQLSRLLQSLKPEYKQRFAVRIGDHLKMTPTSEILYFQSRHKLTYLYTEDGKKYPVQYSLQELEGLLDPARFFRINRQTLVSDRAVLDVAAISNSRLQVKIPFAKAAEVVSRDRCGEFREWLDR